MRKLIKEFSFTLIVLSVIATASITTIIDQVGTTLNEIMVQLGLCLDGESHCFRRNYAIVIGAVVLITFTSNLIVFIRRRKIIKEFRDLIKDGDSLLLKSHQSSQYKSRKMDWWKLYLDWDRNKMQPFIEKYFGKSELALYTSETIDKRFEKHDDQDYDERRSILATRLDRAKKLLENY
jgi:hypothetical protein